MKFHKSQAMRTEHMLVVDLRALERINLLIATLPLKNAHIRFFYANMNFDILRKLLLMLI